MAGSTSVTATGSLLRGLFVGGTLCQESRIIATAALGEDRGHTFVDFGDDAYTEGRAHPMIDPTLRLERIAAEGNDPHCGVLLLDLVLGHGAHPDPAPELAEAIQAARKAAGAAGRELPVVVSLTGTRGDPQGTSATAAVLTAAGASVHLSNAEATRTALSLLSGTDHAGGSR